LPASLIWNTIVAEAELESPLWSAALRAPEDREETPVFSPLGDSRFALGIESIYEGYLLHYGRPRLFSPDDRDTAILLGDYLYAHGLVRITREGDVAAVERLAELLSLCAHLRAEGRGSEDGDAWASTVALLGAGEPEADARLRALAVHSERVH
jgi:hypothetical protein